MCSYSSTPFMACVLLCSSTLFLVLLLLWCLLRYLFVNPWPSPNSSILVPLLFHAFHVVLLCSSNLVLPLSFALCKCGKTRGFFKFHSISRCFNFDVFFVCKFCLKLFYGLLCARPKNTIIETHIYSQKNSNSYSSFLHFFLMMKIGREMNNFLIILNVCKCFDLLFIT